MHYQALEGIYYRSQISQSDYLVIEVENQLLLEIENDDSPIESMSITKSIVGLALGILFDLKKIALEDPVNLFYSSWNFGLKKVVTIRHLLTHTSGMIDGEKLEIDNCIQDALDSDLFYPPETRFNYCNKAVNLLSGIIHQVSGKRMDIFIQESLFTPLGINPIEWRKDHQGVPLAMSGLKIRGRDLLKIGRLILQGGIWEQERLISEEWIKLCMQPHQSLNANYGLLWWLPNDLGFPCYAAHGYLGQFLCIFPNQQMIAIRQIRTGKLPDEEVDHWENFFDQLINFIK